MIRLFPASHLLDDIQTKLGQERFFLALTLMLLTAGLAWLLVPGLCWGDDIFFHLYRMEKLADAIRNGHSSVPVDAAAFDGYGYGIGLFYPDTLLLPPALLRATGLPLVFCVKLYLLALTLLTGLSAYTCANRIAQAPFAGCVAALLYTWSSYYATDVFDRFAFGEVLAFAFVPLAILGLYETLCNDPRRWQPLAYGYAGLLLAHNLSFLQMLFLGACIFAILAKCWIKEPKRLLAILKAVLLCIPLTAFFWLPMLEQLRDQTFTIATVAWGNIAHRAVPLTRMFLAIPDTTPSGNGHFWTPPGIGLPLILLTLLRLKLPKSNSPQTLFRDALIAMGLFAWFLTSALAPWNSFLAGTPFASMQFPWRFLLGATACLAIAAGITLAHMTSKEIQLQQRCLAPLILYCALIWLLNVIPVYKRCLSTGRIAHQAARLRSLEVGTMHYFPATLTEDDVYARGETTAIQGNLNVEKLQRCPDGSLTCQFSGTEGTIELPLAYYKGYKATLDNGKSITVAPSPNGLATLVIPKGTWKNTATVAYHGTPAQKTAKAISLLTLAAIVAFLIRKRMKVTTTPANSR